MYAYVGNSNFAQLGGSFTSVDGQAAPHTVTIAS